MKISCWAVLAFAAWPLVVTAGERWPSPPAFERPTPVELERLRRGEVLEDAVKQDQRGGGARVRALFRAPAAVVWDTLGDCARNFEFVAGLLECELLESAPDHALTRQVAKKHWLSPRLEYRFETTRQPHDWIMIRLVEGDLRELEGSWRFDALDGSGLLLVSHRLRVAPQMPAPRWLVRRTLQRDLVDMLACLRAVAGGSLDAAGAAADRAACPGEQPHD